MRQLYSQTRFQDKVPSIYINAWESDFSKDHLLVIVSEFLEQVKLVDSSQHLKGLINYAFEKFKWLTNKSVKLIGGVASLATQKGAFYTVAKDLQFKEKDNSSDLSSLYLEQKKAVNELRAILAEVVLATEHKQVLIYVDELDRCRPNYAIELLETIKHIFDVEGMIFIVATDTEQLSHSVNAIYGESFDGAEYLSRFFERSAKLPEPDKFMFALFLIENSNIESYLDDLFFPMKDEGKEAKEYLAAILCNISNYYGLTLRRLKQLFEKYESIVLTLDKNKKFESVLLIQLLCEFSHPDFTFSYSKKREGKNTYSLELRDKYKNYNGNKNSSLLFAAMINESLDDSANDMDEYLSNILKILKGLNSKGFEFNSQLKNLIDGEVTRINFGRSGTNNPYSLKEKIYIDFQKEMKRFPHQVDYLSFDEYFNYVELAANIS